MDAHHTKTEAIHEELMDTVKTSHERIEAMIDFSQEAMEASPEITEINPVEMKSETVHEEVPKKEAAVKSFEALKKRHGDRHLAVGRHGKLKGGSRKKLAAAYRGITLHAGVALHKRHRHNTDI
jgi:hypothetical protein